MNRSFLWVVAILAPLHAAAVPLEVTVLDLEGAPAADVDVYCVGWHDHGCRTEPLPERSYRRTDASGVARFEVIGDKQHILYARQGRFGVTDRFVPRRADGLTEMTLQLKYARRITGTIYGSEGQPLEGVQIMALSTVPLGETGPDGRYEIYGMGRGGIGDAWLYEPGYVAAKFSFAFDFSIYDIVLTPGKTIEGSVMWKDGSPVADAIVRANRFETSTNEQGVFQFPALHMERSVTVHARVSREGHNPITAEAKVEPTEGDPVEIHFPFTEHEALVEGTAMPVPPRAYVAGRVRTKSGEPVRARIANHLAGGMGDTVGESDGEGNFRIQFEGRYLNLMAFPHDSTLAMLGEPKRVNANPEKDAEVEIIITDGASVTGTVLDSAGNPMPNHQVYIAGGAYGYRVEVTTNRGRFSFKNLPITHASLQIQTSFRGQSERIYTSVPALKPRERRRGVVISPPSDDGARHDETPTYGQVVFASRAPDVRQEVRFAQATPTPAESSEPNYVPVRIMVVDESNNPVPNVHFSTEGARISGRSGEDGEILFYHDWTGPVSWNIRQATIIRSLYINEYNENINSSSNISVVESQLSADSPNDLLNLRVIVVPQEQQVTWGCVRLGDGASIRPYRSATIIPDGERARTDDLQLRMGWFMTSKLPDTQHAIEFFFKGYQPRVIASGIHYNVGDGPILVTLPPEPMPSEVSAWTVVTGQPATQEAVDQFPGGAYVRSRERAYRGLDRPPEPKQAAPSETPANSRPQPPAPPYRIRFVDEEGRPIDSIYYQGKSGQMESYGRHLAMAPQLNQSYEFVNTKDGWASLPSSGLTIWADGKGFYFLPRIETGGSVPQQVTLTRAASFTVRVVDWEGNPIVGTTVSAANMAAMFRQYPRQSAFIVTDADGKASFEGWPAGSHQFVVIDNSTQQQKTHPFEVVLSPGEHRDLDVMTGPWPEGSPPAMLEAWRVQSRVWQFYELDGGGRPAYPHEIEMKEARERELNSLPADARSGVEKEVLRQMKLVPPLSDWPSDQDVLFLARVAYALEMHEIVEPLKAWLGRYQSGSPTGPPAYGVRHVPSVSRISGMQELVAIIIALDEGDSVDYFAELAADTSVRPFVRATAVVALGMIGTDEAVNAWRVLRDNAYEVSDEVQPKESYTHEEKMTEAFVMTVYGIPRIGNLTDHFIEPWPAHNALVDEDYVYGHLGVGGAHSGGTQIRLRRFGEDWLVIWIGSVSIS